MVIYIFPGVRRTIHKPMRISTEVESIQKNQTVIIELNSVIFELKSIIEDFNNRLDEMEERISDLKDRALVLIQER